MIGDCLGRMGTENTRSVSHGIQRNLNMHYLNVMLPIRVRLTMIGNVETMHDSDLSTCLMISLPMIFKRIVCGKHAIARMNEVTYASEQVPNPRTHSIRSISPLRNCVASI